MPHPSGAPELTPVFNLVGVAQSLVFSRHFVDIRLSLSPFLWPLFCRLSAELLTDYLYSSKANTPERDTKCN
jgi:hypothetical protein